ncbi:MAG: hypothetical protein HY939_03800 [Gammaproteobacteria bacterium]|nr:hypothetical protein [Gammaproteobacteria bacterium]
MNSMMGVRQYIRKLPRGKPFTINSLAGIVTAGNARQILARLVKNGEVARITTGIFVRPKQNFYLGIVLPSNEVIIKTITQKSGETIGIHGAEAARILQLSTQVPVKEVYYTTGYSRKIKLENTEIILKHISHRKLVKPGTVVGLVISALWYMGKNHVSTETINKIKSQLSSEQFNEVIKNINKMPAWMANQFNIYQKENGCHG